MMNVRVSEREKPLPAVQRIMALREHVIVCLDSRVCSFQAHVYLHASIYGTDYMGRGLTMMQGKGKEWENKTK